MEELILKMGCKEYTGKVLLLGSGNKSFLALIRSFGRKGICLHVGWCQQEIYALKSKYISCNHYIPPFSHTDHEWKDTLKRILTKENYDLVVACSDPQIIPLQLYKDELDKTPDTICSMMPVTNLQMINLKCKSWQGKVDSRCRRKLE